MRTLLVLGAIVFGLTAAGVIHFQKNGNNVNVSIDETKLRQETANFIEKGKHIVDDVEDSLQKDASQAGLPSDNRR